MIEIFWPDHVLFVVLIVLLFLFTGNMTPTKFGTCTDPGGFIIRAKFGLDRFTGIVSRDRSFPLPSGLSYGPYNMALHYRACMHC